MPIPKDRCPKCNSILRKLMRYIYSKDSYKTTTKWTLLHVANFCLKCERLFYLKNQEKKAELIKRQKELDKEFAELRIKF